MSTEKPQPAQTPQTDERAPTPAAEPEARKLEIDDVESDEGDDVKGGFIVFGPVGGGPVG
ncbi:MAG: hypothetical protein H6742_09545 [Alphaproteobacteria bacterium]|nr:hypothetical protein [Alphaproteobacteria bacterium]